MVMDAQHELEHESRIKDETECTISCKKYVGREFSIGTGGKRGGGGRNDLEILCGGCRTLI